MANTGYLTIIFNSDKQFTTIRIRECNKCLSDVIANFFAITWSLFVRSSFISTFKFPIVALPGFRPLSQYVL